MTRTCTICKHKQLEKINKHLIDGETYRYIAKNFGLTVASVKRHKDSHIPQLLLKSKEITDLADANNLAHYLNAEYLDIKNIKQKAIAEGNYSLALKAIDRSLKTIEIVAKVVGLIREQQISVNTKINQHNKSLMEEIDELEKRYEKLYKL